MKTKLLFALAFFAIGLCSCSKGNDNLDGTIPKGLLAISHYWINLEIGETAELTILRGSGEYKLTPVTHYYYNAEGEETEFTVSDDYVKARIEGDKIIFERVALYEEADFGHYIISDKTGLTGLIWVGNPDSLLLGGL